MKSKAQIKMGETIAVLIIFFFLLMFGFVFYASVQEKVIEDRYRENVNLKVLQVAQKASYLPELQCSINNIREDNCFDIHKVEVFYDLIEDNATHIAQYYDIFGFSTVILEEIYPNRANYTIFNLTAEDATQTLSSMVPVSIFDGNTNTYAIGLLKVSYSVVRS